MPTVSSACLSFALLGPDNCCYEAGPGHPGILWHILSGYFIEYQVCADPDQPH